MMPYSIYCLFLHRCDLVLEVGKICPTQYSYLKCFFISRQTVSDCGKSLPLHGMEFYRLLVRMLIYRCKKFLFNAEVPNR